MSGGAVKRGQEEQYGYSAGTVQSKEVDHNFHLCTAPPTSSLLLLQRILIRSLSKKLAPIHEILNFNSWL